ncbi:MAG: TetR/AcrR family transcriptional regulator [Labilithrix sp.]|nr:TetR/AcrR family transcriptional regulator [Labilithrix sp.]
MQAAAEIFNRDGYAATDSNRIAREAGYSPGTFYKHFADKKQIFLAVYEEWVAREWAEISAQISSGEDVGTRAEAIVAIFLEHHKRWRGFRASLRALVSNEPDVRDFYRAQRKKQLALLAALRGGDDGRAREADALLLYTVERTADAIADGEPTSLQVTAEGLRGLLVRIVEERIERGATRR